MEIGVDKMDVIKKLNELRLKRNMSVYRLAELSGINQSTLANTFSRKTIPSITNLEIICETLGVSLSQFFSNDETTVPMSKDELEIFNAYKKLPTDLKENINELILSYIKLLKN